MKKRLSIILFILLKLGISEYCLSQQASQASASQNAFDLELAYRWAPIHYQDTDHSNAKADYITKFDYDKNFIGNDNWDHLGTGDLSAHAYFSVVETSTHWFIVYMFFHPRDWDDGNSDQEHENDSEGVLMLIKKGGNMYGSFVAMVTVAHSSFNAYAPENATVTRNPQGQLKKVLFQTFDGNLHPKTAQEPKGHGLYAYPTSDFSGTDARDGIIYYPSKTVTEVPQSGNDRNVKYKLINLFDSNLWDLQLFESTNAVAHRTYATWGWFMGDKSGGCGDGVTMVCAVNSAGAPWIWDDDNDGTIHPGAMALDPALLAHRYFSGLGNFSLTYTRNKYLQDLKKQGFRDNFKPMGWPSQLVLSDLYKKIP